MLDFNYETLYLNSIGTQLNVTENIFTGEIMLFVVVRFRGAGQK
jgi:hypothetical protein